MVKKRFKKVVVRKWNDFVFLYLLVSLVFTFIGLVVTLFYKVTAISFYCMFIPLLIWIPMYFVEVDKEIYYDEM